MICGLYCLIHPTIPFSRGLFYIMIGSGCIAIIFQLDANPAPQPLQQLANNGIGRIVADIHAKGKSLTCQHCGKSFHTPPLIQGSSTFCSEACKAAGYTRLERPRFFLQPPLPPEELHVLLEQAIQFGERAIQAQQSGKTDRPLMIATHRGRGASAHTKKVINGLRLYQLDEWAQQLKQHPPPEPQLQGGIKGSQAFFQHARHAQQALQQIQPQQNPFALFQLTEPIELSDLAKLSPYDANTQAAYDRLHTLLQEGERELQQLLSATPHA
jgi:hypothetical protein